MKCFNHPATDAVGICPECGKAGCGDCLQDLGGQLLCAGCSAAGERQIAADIEDEVALARGRIARSWFAALIGLVLGAASVLANPDIEPKTMAVPCALMMGYAFWSLYWGKQIVQGVLDRIRDGLNVVLFLPVLSWLVLAMVYMVFVTCAGGTVGVFGGGLWAYLRNRRLIREGEIHAAAILDAQ